MTYDCSCDYDMPTWFSTRRVKSARKPHVCFECRAPIFVDEAYDYASGLWDGIFSDYHTCGLCAELLQWALISVPCFCWGYGNLHDDVREMVNAVVHNCPPGFFMEFGRRMIRIRQECRRRKALTA